MNPKSIARILAICFFSISLAFLLPKSVSAENNWGYGELRVDSSTIYNSKDYKLDLLATALPNTTYSSEFTTGWLSVWIANDPSGFFQVGLMAFEDGLRWFAFTYRPSEKDFGKI